MATAEPDSTVSSQVATPDDAPSLVDQVTTSTDDPSLVDQVVTPVDDPSLVDQVATPVDAPSLVAKIIKQVEFYFGDKNLPRDKFLLRILHEEGNEKGWVALETLLDFNRLKKLTTDIPFIASALKESTSGLLEVNEDSTKIRRITPIPDTGDFDYFDMDKSIYAKGFPMETSIDELETFFESFGKITLIRRRYLKDKKFKGSVFVEFSEISTATDFVKDDSIRFNDTELIRFMKKEYLEKKAIERQQTKKNNQIEKSQKLREQVENDIPFISGALLKLEGLPNTTRREEIKALLGKERVRFMDLNIGDVVCVVMFNVENGAADSVKEIGTEENTLKLGESVITYKIIEEDDAKTEWLRLCVLIGAMGKRRDKQSSRGSRRGGRGKRGSGRGRKGNWRQSDRNRGGGDVEKVELGKRSTEEAGSTAKHVRIADPDED